MAQRMSGDTQCHTKNVWPIASALKKFHLSLLIATTPGVRLSFYAQPCIPRNDGNHDSHAVRGLHCGQRRAPGRRFKPRHRIRIACEVAQGAGVQISAPMAVTCMSSETWSGTRSANAAPSGSCGQKGKGRSESKSTSRSYYYARLLLLLLVGRWVLTAR
jgi:hypothetical protein